MKPNFALLRKAVAVIAAIPDNVIDLRTIERQVHPCGTVCCAAGWLTHDNDFNEIGLTPSRHPLYGYVRLNGEDVSYEQAVSALFDVTNKQAYDLFAPREYSAYDREGGLSVQGTDKQLWLHRVQRFFEAHGEVL